MRSLWKQHPKREHERDCYSVIDLGASLVKVLVVRREGDRTIILGRSQLPTHPAAIEAGLIDAERLVPGWDALDDLGALAGLCERVLCAAEDATEAADGHKTVPDDALISVPSAWLRGALGSGRVQRTALEMPIEPEECAEPVKRAGRRALRNLGRRTGSGRWDVVDATVVAFSIDGHRVTSPIGFRGHTLEATVYAVAAPREVVRALYELADYLQLELPCLVPEPMSLAGICPGDGLVVEVGAQKTGLCLTGYGAPLASGNVNMGGVAWTQALAGAFKFTESRAEMLKLAYSSGRLRPEVEDAVRRVLASVAQDWLSRVMDELRSWRVDLPWSPQVYLTGGASQLAGMRELVTGARWLDEVPFPHTPAVRLWDGSDAAVVEDRTGGSWEPASIVTLATAIWAGRPRGPETVDGMLRRALEIS